MKAFKKWYWDDFYSSNNLYLGDGHLAAEIAWRAALNWVLDYCSGQTEDLRDCIFEELNGEEE